MHATEKDRREERVKERAQRTPQYHHHQKPEKHVLRLLHSFIKKRVVVFSFFQPFFSPPPRSVRLALAHPHKPSHHSAHLCQTLQTPPQTQTDPANQSVCVCVWLGGLCVFSCGGGVVKHFCKPDAQISACCLDLFPY